MKTIISDVFIRGILLSKIKDIFFGLSAGFINGLLGAGGGMLVVPMLQTKLDTKRAHATCVAVILPITVVSAVWYIIDGRVNINDAIIYMIFGIPGAIIGTFALRKLNKTIIKKAFSLLIIWAGIRILMK